MPRAITVAPHLTYAEIYDHFRSATDATARKHWHVIWMAKEGRPGHEIARAVGVERSWVFAVVKRYNARGAAAMGDLRHQSPGAARLIPAELESELASVLARPGPGGGLWTARAVAAWMSERLGRPVSESTGLRTMRRAGFTLLVPRPRHVQADAKAQDDFKKKRSRRPSSRFVVAILEPV